MPTCCLTILSDRTTNIKLNCTFEEALRWYQRQRIKARKTKGKLWGHSSAQSAGDNAIFKAKNNLNPTFMKKDIY